MHELQEALQANTGNADFKWKTKCEELYELCCEMKEDNEYITERCRQLADLAVGLVDRPTEDISASLFSMSHKDSRMKLGTSLPKLKTTNNESVMSVGLSGAQADARTANKLAKVPSVLDASKFGFRQNHYAGEASTNAKKRHQRHNRGRTLLDIKHEVDAAAANHLSFSLKNDDSTHFSNKNISKEFQNKTNDLSKELSQALQLSKELKESLLETSQLEAGPNQPDARHKRPLFVNSSLHDYQFSQPGKVANLGLEPAKSKKQKLQSRKGQRHISEHQVSFYNMKDQMGMQKLYNIHPENAGGSIGRLDRGGVKSVEKQRPLQPMPREGMSGDTDRTLQQKREPGEPGTNGDLEIDNQLPLQGENEEARTSQRNRQLASMGGETEFLAQQQFAEGKEGQQMQ